MKNVQRRIRENKALVMPQFLTIGVLSMAITMLGFRQFSRSGTVPVVVAVMELKAGEKILTSHLRSKRFDKESIPEGAINNVKQIVGRTLKRPVGADDILTVPDFVAPKNNRSGFSQHIPSGHVLVALNLSNRTFPQAGFVRGDRIDVLITGKVMTGRGVTRSAQVIARDLLIVGFSQDPAAAAKEAKENSLGIDLGALSGGDSGSSKNESQLLLAVRPEDVLRLAQVDNEPSYNISIVLHGTSEFTNGQRLVIENRPIHKESVVEVIHGSKSEFVSVPSK